MKESKLFSILVATFVVIGLGVPSIVMAQAGNPREITVSYADLNLDSDAGVKALYGRLQQASRGVCGATSGGITETIERLRIDQCYRETLADAVEKIDIVDPATFVVIGLGAPAIVLAGTLSPLETTVSYADLNLESDAGTRVLYGRLQKASRQVCGVTAAAGSSGSIQRLHADQCYRETLAVAVEEIDNEDLTRIHAG
jgi:UrcA family protein